MEAGQARRAVVVGVDGSQRALRAVCWAAAEAASRQAPLRIVTVYRPYRDGKGGEPGRRARDLALGHATAACAEAAQVAERAHPGMPVQRQLVVGSPVPVLDAQARTAAVLVVGDRGTGGVAGLSLGSVAAAMGTRAVCPVVVVRGEDEPDASRPVVVGVDGSSTSDAALTFAFEAAAAHGVALAAVHTWCEFLATPIAALGDREAIDAAERERLDERLAGWRAKHPTVAVHLDVQRDFPAHALTARSRAAQLVVVGSRGRGWLAGLVLGSVSHTLMHRAHCPVAVVRPEIGVVT